MVPAPQRATGSSATIANSAAPTVVALSSLAQRCGAAARKDQRNLAALIMLAALTRARRRRFQRALTPTDLHRPARRRCGCWPTSTVLFRGIGVGRSRRWTLALGRPAPMLTAASPGRGGGDGAGAAAGYRVIGNDRKFRSTDSGGALLARSALRSSGSERSAEFGSVDHAGCPHARARRRRFQRALTPTDLHRPARRRCGCWPTSTVLFRGIGVGRFGAGRWRSGDRRRC